jgi:hypothetical protein
LQIRRARKAACGASKHDKQRAAAPKPTTSKLENVMPVFNYLVGKGEQPF